MRRAAVVWLLLFAVYASTLGLHAAGRSDYAGDEPHYLLTAKSLVDDRSPDLRDEYSGRAYRDFYPYALAPHGALTKGRADEPHGVGFPLLIAPAYAIGGAKGVELFLAALAALAIALGYRLALRVVPDPWALAAALAVGLSPPLVAYSTAVYPELPAAAALCGAALLALRIGDRPQRRVGWSCFGLLALLPWLGLAYALPAAVVAAYGYRSMRRARRPVLALTCLEILGFSVALYVGVNEGLFGGPTPYSAEPPGAAATGTGSPLDYLGRAYRLVALFLDRHYGMLRWAPVLVLALWGAWLVWRERRSGLIRAIPGLRDEQAAGAMCAAMAAAQLLVAAFVAPTAAGPWFPGRHLVTALPPAIGLVSVALRRAPRAGALLALVGVAASVWVYADVRLGDGTLVSSLPRAPLGPLTGALPLFAHGARYPYVLAAAIGAALVAFVVVSERRLAFRTRA